MLGNAKSREFERGHWGSQIFCWRVRNSDFCKRGLDFVNYENTESVRLLVALANIFVFFVCLLALMKNISKKLNELERSKKDD